MAVLAFERRPEVGSVEPPSTLRRPRTRCEDCGAPAVREGRGVAPNGFVLVVCGACHHRWAMLDRRLTARPSD